MNILQRIAHRQQLVIRRGRGNVEVQSASRQASTCPAFSGQSATGTIHQNASHRLRRRRQRNAVAHSTRGLSSAEIFSQASVNQGGGFGGVLIAGFAGQPSRRQAAQFRYRPAGAIPSNSAAALPSPAQARSRMRVTSLTRTL
ncbi:MAG: hypothetical protein WDM76_05350 [Limisphaerales bacterium]